MELVELSRSLQKAGYICSMDTALTVYLALKLAKPLLVEGPPGVGKTQLAITLSEIFNTELLRLQCYEGLDETRALYEWNYQRQLLRIQLSKELGCRELQEKELFSKDCLLERPLLKAISADRRVVLLIDEVDKCDQEFEAFLFELLSDFQVSIPELGTIKAREIPIVVLTSNSERELSDGLRRRCIYLFLDFPTIAQEAEIIKARVPACGDHLRSEIARIVNMLRRPEIRKKPSVAETLDWARALVLLDRERLDGKTVDQTLSILLKNETDLAYFRDQLGIDAVDRELTAPG